VKKVFEPIQVTFLLILVSGCLFFPPSQGPPPNINIPREYQQEVQHLEQQVSFYHHEGVPVLDKDHADIHSRLGSIYLEIGELGEARYNLERSIGMLFQNADAHYNLGRLLTQIGRHKQAVKELKVALDQDPSLIEAHKYLGDLYTELGMEKEAEDQLNIYYSPLTKILPFN